MAADPRYVAKVRNMLTQGASLREVAQETGRSHVTIRQLAIRHDIPRRTRATVTSTMRAEVAELYISGATITAIALEVGLHRNTVSTILDRDDDFERRCSGCGAVVTTLGCRACAVGFLG